MGRRRSALGFDYVGGLKEESTPFAGVGLLVELYRQAGVEGAAERALPKKGSSKGCFLFTNSRVNEWSYIGMAIFGATRRVSFGRHEAEGAGGNDTVLAIELAAVTSQH